MIDRLLEDGRIQMEGLCGTSDGSMNAVVFAYGNMVGGRGGARQAPYNFWKKISAAGALYSPLKQTSWEYISSHANQSWNQDGSITYPLFYHTVSRGVLVIHINPIERDEVPTRSADILRRLNT